MFKSPPNLLVCHGSGRVDAPRGIVVVGFDPWTLCHMSTNPSPSRVADSPSYKKNVSRFLETLVSAPFVTIIKNYKSCISRA